VPIRRSESRSFLKQQGRNEPTNRKRFRDGAELTGLLRHREARSHAVIAACALWIAATVTTFAAPGYRSLTGRLKGGDFIQFYTLGHIAFGREYPRLSTANALHTLQVQLLPASDPEFYFPVYPPQTALIFAPLALLSFRAAAAVWTATLICAYAAIVWYTWRPLRDVLTDKLFVAAAAAAFPPFWSLVLHEQTTVFPLAAFFCGWLALERDRPFLAGLALGILAIKPQFGLVLAVVVLAAREWRIILGALCSVALQLAAVIYGMGVGALRAYIENVRGMPKIEPLLEPDPWQMHSLRTVTTLVPGISGRMLWIVLSVAVIITVTMAWRTRVPLTVRFGLLILGTVLVNPHLIVYDATVLVLPLLWFGAWVERGRLSLASEFWLTVYALFIFLLLPTARLFYVQVSVLLMAWMFWRIARVASLASARTDSPREIHSVSVGPPGQ
jgi:alpha-1,2-mannosyltransferase